MLETARSLQSATNRVWHGATATVVDSTCVTALAFCLALAIAPPESSEPVAPSEVSEFSDVVETPTEVVEPSAEPAPAGGFGTIENTQTSSNVVAPPPPPPTEGDDTGPRRELSGLIEAGYAQNNVGNVERLDHHGLSLRAHVVYYPWISKQRRVAGGLGAAYAYQGLNRWALPSTAGLKSSKAQQHQIMFSLDLLVRPHPEFFSVHTAAMIGLGLYTSPKLFAANRAAVIPRDEYAFVAAGSLGLCSAWDIVCVTGGAQLLVGVQTVPMDPLIGTDRVIDPWGWHVGVGFDILRILARANRVPA